MDATTVLTAMEPHRKHLVEALKNYLFMRDLLADVHVTTPEYMVELNRFAVAVFDILKTELERVDRTTQV